MMLSGIIKRDELIKQKEGVNLSELSKLHHKALEFLSRREHSRAELTRKLVQRGYAKQDVAQLLDEFILQGYQSDDRYASAYIRSRAARGYGPERISMELRHEGLDRELIAQHINSGDMDWFQLAHAALCKKFDFHPAENIKELLKRKQYLIYRGFTFSQVNAIIEQLTKE